MNYAVEMGSGAVIGLLPSFLKTCSSIENYLGKEDLHRQNGAYISQHSLRFSFNFFQLHASEMRKLCDLWS
jgi:hypothetical protein